MPERPTGYDRLARPWNWLERRLHGERLERARFACLDALEAHQPQRVLLVGDGDGRFLAELLGRLPRCQVTSVDTSLTMLSLARSRLARTDLERTRLLLADARGPALEPDQPFDALVCHCFLDQFEGQELERWIERLTALLGPESLWAFADYRMPPSGMARLRASLLLRGLYFAFSILTDIRARRLEDPTPRIEARGFRLEEVELFDRGLLVSRVFRAGARAGRAPGVDYQASTCSTVSSGLRRAGLKSVPLV